MEEVSLYIPCFNAEATITESLDAVFKQSFPLKEVIVVDDGSTDKSAALASRFPVRIIRHRQRNGLAAARNTALRSIKTDFVASLDADCAAEPFWLERLMQSFKEPRIAGAGGRVIEKNSHAVFDLWRSVHMKQSWGDRKSSPSFLYGANTVFRKNALMSVSYYDEGLKSNYEDVDVSRRLKKKGWSLIYDPEAPVYHLKTDTICTLLNTYWLWNVVYYKRKGFYAGPKHFLLKVKDNIGLANRYLVHDKAAGKDTLLYLDFLLALHHSFRDFEYYLSRDKNNFFFSDFPAADIWLSLMDLDFFYYFNAKKSVRSTFMPKSNTLIQNFLSLNLAIGRLIDDNFTHNRFKEIVFRHLFLSFNKTEDAQLIHSLLALTDRHQDWSGVLKKKQGNLHTSFLESFVASFEPWINGLSRRFPGIIGLIESAALLADA